MLFGYRHYAHRKCPTSFDVIGCRGDVDLVFVVDSSGSIRRERFPYVLDFIARFVNETEVDMEKTRIGCVQFSRDSSTAFYLDVC